MAASKRSADSSSEQITVERKPKRLRGIIAAFLAAIVIIVVRWNGSRMSTRNSDHFRFS